MDTNPKQPDAKFKDKSNDDSEKWLKDPALRKSVKEKSSLWQRDQEKPSEPQKQPRVRSGIARSSGSESKDGSKSKQSHHHNKSEISVSVGAGSKTVFQPQSETTHSSTQPQKSSQVQQISQPAPNHESKDLSDRIHLRQPPSKNQRLSYVGELETTQSSTHSRTSSQIQQPAPIPVVSSPPAEAQLNTPQPYTNGKHSTTKSVVHTSPSVHSHSSSYLESHIDSEVTKLKTELEQLRKENEDLLGEVEAQKYNSHIDSEVTKLKTELEQLCKEKADLLGEVEAHKYNAQTYKEDFEQERKDREKAHSQLGEIEKHYKDRLQSMEAQLKHTEQDLQKTKETLVTTDTTLHSQIEQLSERLIEKDRQMEAIVAENDHLQEEVLSKTQQVERYKEQVDQYHNRVERYAQESEERQSRAAEWKSRHDTIEVEMQRERSQREAFERRIADLEKVNDQLRQESSELAQSQVEVTKLTSEVEQLCREKADLLGEVEAHKLTKCHELDAEQLSQMEKLVGLNADYIAQINELKAQVRKLEQDKDTLQNEVQIARTKNGQSELAPYQIESFNKLEEGVSKGSGSFGSIHLIEVNGVPCIAKRLHDILVGRGQAEVVNRVQKQSIEQLFRRECVFLSRLRHPNIVQFMGVHCGQDQSDLTLIMECLPMDLEKCLEQYPNIPLPIKISVLLDVSYGLLHLHSQMPPIIHRDLTAANILLTSDMKAKIADLGVSKILDLHPLHGASQTAGPGALAYMPPEALKRVPAYNTKLDDFSFGVVMLYVANQEFPMAEDRSTPEAVQKQETHIEKRRDWVDQVGKSHPLYELITACLQDLPDRRPTTSEINNSLKQLSKCHPRRFQDIMEMNQHLSRLEKRISASLSELQSQASMLKKIVEED